MDVLIIALEEEEVVWLLNIYVWEFVEFLEIIDLYWYSNEQTYMSISRHNISNKSLILRALKKYFL